MAGFDDYAYALGFDDTLNGFGDLGGEALLDLQAAGENFDEARNLAEANYFPVGNVGYVDLAEERQHVMLAEAEHLDVFDDDHLVVGDGEERAFEQSVGIFLVAAGEELERFADALGGLLQAFALGVLAEADEHFVDKIFEAGAGESGWFDCGLGVHG